MKYIRKRVLSGELLFGAWCALGSSITVEIAGRSGVDWVLIDLEHGMGDYGTALHQLQAAEITAAAPIVRVVWNEAPLFKRMLDLGASGIMVPWVSTVQEAQAAVSAMRFPPLGIRGTATALRATEFRTNLDIAKHLQTANEELLTIVQVETEQAVRNSAEIAAVDGVDVLFVGPVDLSVGLGIPGQFDDPRFTAALGTVVESCRREGKVPGILCHWPDRLESWISKGFKFVSIVSDSGSVMSGMQRALASIRSYKA